MSVRFQEPCGYCAVVKRLTARLAITTGMLKEVRQMMTEIIAIKLIAATVPTAAIVVVEHVKQALS